MNQRWNTGTYDTDMAFVSQFGESLIELLRPQPGEQILDWGCGTGDLTAAIAASGATVTGIDASDEMIQTARDKHPQLSFILADGQNYVTDQPVDAVFSNAALHWLTDANGTAASIAASLRTGGRFVAEFGGLGNIASIVTELPNAFTAIGCIDKLQLPWYFPSIGQYTTLLEQHGLTVGLALSFDRPTPLEAGEQGFQRWLNTFSNGILSVLTPSEREEVLSYMEQKLKPTLFQDNRWVMDIEEYEWPLTNESNTERGLPIPQKKSVLARIRTNTLFFQLDNGGDLKGTDILSSISHISVATSTKSDHQQQYACTKQ